MQKISFCNSFILSSLTHLYYFNHFLSCSIRTIHSSIYFPQVFFAYFLLFHIYYFSCPFGFSYAALISTVLFLLHAMIFFWNRYELPAVLSGQVSRESPRMAIITNQGVYRPESPSQNTTTQPLNRDAASTSMQRIDMASYPSMSSLGRMSSPLPSNIIGQDQDGYWILMNGEVRLIFLLFQSRINVEYNTLITRATIANRSLSSMGSRLSRDRKLDSSLQHMVWSRMC